MKEASFPLKSPTINGAGVIFKFPILSPFAVVVPNMNLSSDSSQPINALLLGSKVPRLIRIPLSLGFATLRPEFNNMRLSLISKLVELILVAEPDMVNTPVTFKSLKDTSLFVPTS